jgi:serine/threonine protein kinase
LGLRSATLPFGAVLYEMATGAVPFPGETSALIFQGILDRTPTPNPEIMTASEVKSHSSIDRFLVVFHSPTGMAETGLLACRSEKTDRTSRSNANTKNFLWSALTMKTSELAGISRDLREAN